MNLEIIDPTNYAGWDDLLLSTHGYSFFHSSAWARVLKNSYAYTPLYFASIKNGQFSALVPVMEVNSVLTGKRGVSLPFTDYCEPIIDEGISFKDLFDHIIEFGKKRRWKYIELRGGDRYLRNQESGTRNQEAGGSNPNPDSWNLNPASSLSAPCALRPAPFALHPTPFTTYLGHTLDLTGGEEKILSSLRDSTKRNIKKAIREGVTIKILNSLESVKEFYRLNCMTRKEHGLPPQPYYFFQKIYNHIISRGLGFVTLASHNGQNIAGAVYFHSGQKALYKYGASDLRFQNLRANNLVMGEAIKWYSQNGYKTLGFGRTDLENKGLIQFKSGWGTTENQIHYYRYDLGKKAFISESSKVKEWQNQIFRKLPPPAAKLVGSLLYRHVG